MHVLHGDALDILRPDAPQFVDELARRAIVALIELGPREERRLVSVDFVLQEVVGKKLLNETLQAARVDQPCVEVDRSLRA